MRQSKQSRIDELERTLEIEQEGLRSYKENLIRLTNEHNQAITRLKMERDFLYQRAMDSNRLMTILENITSTKGS